MAKLKAVPKSYAEAAEYLAGRDSVKLGNNTWLVYMDDHANPELSQIGVRLHNTYIVRFYQDGRVSLHTGGYRTVTTKDRINQFIKGRVYQQALVWYFVRNRGELGIDWANPTKFTEGINVA